MMDKRKRSTLIGTGAIFAAIAVVGGALIDKKRKNNKIKAQIVCDDSYETGRIRKFGTLYLNGIKQKCPVDFENYEDVYEYMGERIEIKDSDKDDMNKLSWIEINDNNKKLLICDRNILTGISWDELNNQNLVFGKVIMIEGKKYMLRLLKGGDTKKDSSDNEWDRYIINKDEHSSLPISTKDDRSNKVKNSIDKIKGANNNLWHWYKLCSFTQNTKGKKSCIIRGFYSNTYFSDVKKEVSYKTIGYRPVLELIE